MRHISIAVLAIALAPIALTAQQRADTTFDMSVARPAFTANGPRLAIDEAHENFHTMTGRYAPFAKLMRADGYRVSASAAPFDAASLARIDILVIANAGGSAGAPTTNVSAFTPAEIAAVRAWVERGGSLLLVADHAPFGGAAAALAERFGVGMTKGFAFDTATTAHAQGNASFLLYTRTSGLADHAITRGRDASERVSTVVAYTGQSLTAPAGATPLLTMSPTAQERPSRDLNDTPVAVGGKLQGLTLTVGRGRVVVLGEAAMLSAQVIDQPGRPPFYMGMNVPGTDDKLFALNVVRWLARAL